MSLLTCLYHAITRCCYSTKPAQRPRIRTNETIQKKLVLQADKVDSKTHARVWDQFTSETDDCSYDPQLESLLPDIKGDQAYDLGAGIGPDTRLLLEQGWKVTAVDISPKAVAVLKALKHPCLEVIESELETFQFSKKADLIVAMNVLGFCNAGKVKQIWNRMHDALCKGGYLVCTLPARNSSMFARWDLSRKDIRQFFLDERYKVISYSDNRENPYTTHPIRLVLQKA